LSHFEYLLDIKNVSLVAFHFHTSDTEHNDVITSLL